MKPANNPILQKIEEHLDALAGHLRNIRDTGSITHVHEARVAARRLRTAIWVLKKYFPKKTRKQWERNLRRLSRALSDARDLDVHIEFLKNFPGGGASGKQAQEINALTDIYKDRRREGQAKVIAEAKRFTGTKTGGNISRAAVTVAAKDSDTLHRLGRKKIVKCLKGLLAHEPYVKKPQAQKQLHRMRIAAKRLRYALEFLQSLYPKESSEEYIKRLIEIQRALGSIHEFDVWIEQARELKNNEGIAQFIKPYRKECGKLRTHWYKKFVHIWQENKKAKTWQKIYEMAS